MFQVLNEFSSFQGVNSFLVLSFKDRTVHNSNKQYFVLAVEVNDCNAMIDGKKLFNQTIKMI